MRVPLFWDTSKSRLPRRKIKVISTIIVVDKSTITIITILQLSNSHVHNKNNRNNDASNSFTSIEMQKIKVV